MRRFLTSRWRRGILLAIHLVAIAALGGGALLPIARNLAHNWLKLDTVIRTVALGVVQPTEVLPVTLIDIDDVLYRDRWANPATTPRHELARMIGLLEESGLRALVLDVDLSWGDEDPVLASFLEGYRGPVPLVLVKRLEDRLDGLQAAPAPVDPVVEANPLVSWAHSHFYVDRDDSVRRWRAWLPACLNDRAIVLPAVAARALELSHPGSVDGRIPEASSPCGRLGDEPDSHAILFRHDFGTSGGESGLPTVDSRGWAGPAQRLFARDLLDGMRVDRGTYFDDRVGVIGGTHHGGRDHWRTPIGILPGAVVLANTIIHAPLQVGGERPGEGAYRLLIGVLFLMMVSLTALLRDLLAIPLALLLSGTLVLVALAAFGYYAIIGVVEIAILIFLQYRVLHLLIVGLWDDIEERKWRACLPPPLASKEGAVL